MKVYISLILGCLLVFSCRERHSELTGHWLSKRNQLGQFMTVDFEKEYTASWRTGQDTMYHKIIFNKNSFTMDGGDLEYVFMGDNNYEFYSDDNDNQHILKFEGDSLRVSGHNYTDVFFRSNESETIYEEFFNQTGVTVNLPEASELDSLTKSASWLNIYFNVGKNPRSIYPDSIFINYKNRYIVKQDIIGFKVEDFVPETEVKNVLVFINADKLVPDEFVSDIVNNFRRTDSTTLIFRSYFNYKTKKLFHRQLGME